VLAFYPNPLTNQTLVDLPSLDHLMAFLTQQKIPVDLYPESAHDSDSESDSKGDPDERQDDYSRVLRRILKDRNCTLFVASLFLL